MALGGGKFVTQNKILPGAYINFISTQKERPYLSDRGVCAFAIDLDWGEDDKIFTVTAEEFQKNSIKYFGYDYSDEKLKGLRDLFKHAKKCHFYKLMNNGKKASNKFCSAKFKGSRGNYLRTVIRKNIDYKDKLDVLTYFGAKLVDSQTVKNYYELKENPYVEWKDKITLEETAGIYLENGDNGESIKAEDYVKFLELIQSYNFNILGCLSEINEVKALVVSFTKRMRDEIGLKFQTVLYGVPSNYEGVIAVDNKIIDEHFRNISLVYWVAGACASCKVNESLTNKIYDGEFEIDVNFTQDELVEKIKAGRFTFHKVGDEIRVLLDINSYSYYKEKEKEKSEDFSNNQTIRVLDQIGNDIAIIFNSKYLGKIPNDKAGRISLWNDIVNHHKKLEEIRAIENFNPDFITVKRGENKKSIIVNDVIEPVNAMEQLYMTVIIK